MDVVTPEGLVGACQQAVAMGTVMTMAAMVPVHVVGMYAFFTKLDKMFNPHRLLANQRRRHFVNRIANKY